jgi:hypothetical protein
MLVRFRPRLQSLEFRVVPAQFNVLNANDAGAGSLRQAILDANAHNGPDVIAFDANFFATPRTITLTAANGQLAITDGVTVGGPGSALLTVNGGGVTRVFNVENPAATIAVTLTGLTVTGGNGSTGGPTPTAGDGGGIRTTDEALTLADVVVTGNSAGSAMGGGIAADSAAAMTFAGCTVSGNTAVNGAGVYFFNGGSLFLANSTVSGNAGSGARGGGIYFFGAAAASGFTIRNSTVAGNTTAGSGGGVFLRNFVGTALIQNSTITGNSANTTATTAGYGGGGIALMNTPAASAITITSSIVSGNTATAINGRSDIAAVAGPAVNVNYSAVGDPDGFTMSGSSGNNLAFGAALGLRPLANYGGRLQTIALSQASPAVDTGSNSAGLSNDEGGAGYVRVRGAAADIGALEVDPPAAFGGPYAPVTTTGAATYSFDITYDGTTPIDVATLGAGDIRVTGPGGFNQIAMIVGIDFNTNGSPRTATYRITAPGGTFDPPENGTYTVAVEAGQVANTNGYTAAAGVLNTFTVAVPTTYTVTNLNDSGSGSLRQAILDANTTTPGVADIIAFQAGLTGTIPLTGVLPIADGLTILGPGADIVAVNGQSFGRVIQTVNTGIVYDVVISGLTLTGGGAGCIEAFDANLTLDHVAVTGNIGSGVVGGDGNLVVRNSVISGNSDSTGGGIFMLRGSLLLENSAVTGNTATSSTGGGGGGIYAAGVLLPGGVVIRNSTIAGNTAPSGGGVSLKPTNANVPFLIQNSTITGNTSTTNLTTAGLGGGGLALITNTAAIISVASTVLSGNTASATNGRSDIAMPPAATLTANFSAVGDPDGFVLSSASGNNLPFGTVLGLGSLANNGGLTPTISFAANSPLRNAGSNPSNLTTDQRGPGFARVVGAAADIGAFEFPSLQVASVSVNGGAAQRSRLTSVAVTFNGPVAFAGATASAFQLSRIGGGAIGGFTAMASIVNGVTAVTLSNFTGSETEFGSLADGRYTLTVLANQVSADGQQLDGNGDGQGGDNFTFGDAQGLFRLFGDVNGDQTVNGFDLGFFRNAFGTQTGDANFLSYLDFNGDDVINGFDLGQFRTRFGTVLP